MTTHTERAHARLSPSGAKRWIACPGSIRLTEGIEDKSSPFANEGTAAHELAEHCLNNGFDAHEFVGNTIVNIDGAIASERFLRAGGARTEDRDRTWLVTKDMAHAVMVYVEHVRGLNEQGYDITLEERVSMEHVVEGMTGTADCLAYHEDFATLHVVDYKHGAGVPVYPEENEQLMAYAIGAVKRFGNRPVDRVVLTIVQPRASSPKGPVRTWETTPEHLAVFAEKMSAAAEVVDLPDAPLYPGDHCQFCKAAGFCPALREQSLAIAMADFADLEPETASPAQVAEWLDKVGTVETWCRKVREFANAEAKAGRMPPGYKFVEKRATRKWRDAEQVKFVLETVFEFDDADIFDPPTLKSVAQFEKTIGKKNMGPLREYIEAKSSGLVLAPESDPRPAAQASAADDFEEVALED